MSAPSALGSQVELADGRVATVVFNGLCGVGAKLGLHDPRKEDFADTHGDLFDATRGADWPWKPDVLLRPPWRDGQTHFDGMELVGAPVSVLRGGGERKP
jgi:hypothetical protein